MSKSTARKVPSELGGILGGIKDWQALLFIGLVVGVFFRDILLQKAFFWEDFIYQYYAFRNFAAVSLAHGELPLWNPYTFSGMPFQADIQTALFYLPNLLLTFFVQGERLHFFWVELLVVFHFVIAGGSMYFLAKDFGIEKPYALFSALIFSLSGFMITHAIHLTFICQVAWTPLVVLFFRRALLENSIIAMIISGLVLGNAILGGAPQFTLYTLLFLLAFFLFEFISSLRANGFKSSRYMIPIAGGTVALALAVTAIQLLPTFELGSLSQRAEISFEKSSESSLLWKQLITLFVPKYFGATGAQGSTYWAASSYWDYWETCLYIGIPGLFSVVCAIPLIKKNKYVGFFFGVMLFSLLYALGDNFYLHSIFFHAVPGFDKFRIPGRMSFLFTFSAAVISGFGIKYFFESSGTQSAILKRMLIGFGGLGLFSWILGKAGVFMPSQNPQQYQQISTLVATETTTALIVVVAVCAILFLAQRRVIASGVAVAVMILLQVIDMNVFGFNQNNGNLSPEEYYGRTKELVSFLKTEGKKEYFRINARDGGAMLLDRNQGMVDRVFMMEGYTPLSLQRIFTPGKDWSQTCDMLNAKYRIDVDKQQRTMNLTTATTYLPRAYMVFDAKVLEADSLVEPYMRSLSFNPAQTVVLSEQPDLIVKDTAYTDRWSTIITSYTTNVISLSVTTPKDGYLVLSEIYYTGWKAFVNGEERKVYRADWNLRALSLPAGSHSIEVRFEPESFSNGMWISLTALSFSIIGFVFIFVRKSTVNTTRNTG